MKLRILLISQDPWDLAFCREVAKRKGCELVNVPNVAGAAEAARAGAFADAFVDATTDVATRDYFDSFKDAGFRTHMISGKQLDESPHLGRLRSNLERFIFRNGTSPEENAMYYLGVVMPGEAKPLFEESTFKEVPLAFSTDKSSVLEQLRGALSDVKGLHESLATTIITAADELMMNAIYDAPISSKGEPIHSKTPRNTRFPLEGKSAVRFQYAINGNYVAIRATDRFGSLNHDRLLTKVSANFMKKGYRVNKETAGSGIGLNFVLRMGGSLMFDYDPNDCTEVSAIFKIVPFEERTSRRFRFLCVKSRLKYS